MSHLVLPSPLRVSDGYPFVIDSVHKRFCKILDNVIEENQLQNEKRQKIEAFRDAIANASLVIENIDGQDGGPDWTNYSIERIGMNVVDVDWFFFEYYAYRYLLRVVNYYQERCDPFAPQKAKSLSTGIQSLEIDNTYNTDPHLGFTQLLINSLWGNRNDLSLSAGTVEKGHGDLGTCLLVNHVEKCVTYLLEHQFETYDFVYILDNCGTELLSDLVLIEFWLRSSPHATCYIHAKKDPVFVSDALESDVLRHIEAIKQKFPQIGASLERAQHQQRLVVTSDALYTSPLPFWETPQQMREVYKNALITVVKGDANYRRLLGDRQWPFRTPFTSVMGYWPGPAIVSVRTCKAPIVVGLDTEHLVAAHNEPWLVDGSHGCISFSQKSSK